MHFSDDSKFLLVSSDRSTLHIYSLCSQYSNTKSYLKPLGGILPKYFSSEWSLAKVTVPSDRYIAGITKDPTKEDTYNVNVFMYNGFYIHYVFKPKEGTITKESEGQFYDGSSSEVFCEIDVVSE
jgi:hypothetical protein